VSCRLTSSNARQTRLKSAASARRKTVTQLPSAPHQEIVLIHMYFYTHYNDSFSPREALKNIVDLVNFDLRYSSQVGRYIGARSLKLIKVLLIIVRAS